LSCLALSCRDAMPLTTTDPKQCDQNGRNGDIQGILWGILQRCLVFSTIFLSTFNIWNIFGATC